MLIEAYKNKDFEKILRNAHIVAPDGVPILWAFKLMHGIIQDRVAGMDLLPDLITEATLKKIPVLFYGGTEKLLSKTKELLYKRYPDLIVAGFLSPPFRTLSDFENEQIIEQINKSGAGLVFVILGCPKQEKWMASVDRKVNAVIIGVGGALPVFIGVQKRAPKWMQNAGLEWVFRLLQEPRRLFKRYAITNSLFLYLLLKYSFKQFFRKSVHL
jgi:N-acetylglucosaminyldiphosphoundecaprenol N-acetyl-beta-D-mannosaminyltransferase